MVITSSCLTYRKSLLQPRNFYYRERTTSVTNKGEYSSWMILNMERPTEAFMLLHLPTFNPLDVQTWFAQLQVIFTAKSVTSQRTKFAYVVEKLPKEISRKILDKLKAICEVNPYDTPRQTILHRTVESETKMLTNLFSNVSIKNKTPSRLLRQMGSLLHLHTLPENMEGADLEKLAEITDKTCENACAQNVNAIPNPPTSQMGQIHQHQSSIDKLTERIETMSVRSGQYVSRYHRQHCSWNICNSWHSSKVRPRNVEIYLIPS